ncbi:MAG: ATP phosphoribosyltransferase regulatory subunit [Clostridia bacterium]|nr:ATP phosphoribosyltransferase regulatory subunit [Clostridia bacterium]
MIFEQRLKNEEKILFKLRYLYTQYGYQPFKMSKFEEYDFYARNKEFLVSDSVITFTDTHGKLLALKPDVTLSIIKNATEEKNTKNKVYYNENVYRVSGSSREYKEIMQAGLECIGDLDLYDMYEVVSLSAKSLGLISDDYVLEISHMGILSALLDTVTTDSEFKSLVVDCIRKKSEHELLECCEKYEASSEATKMLTNLIKLYGAPSDVCEKLKAMKVSKEFENATEELCQLCQLLKDTKEYKNIRLDFSIVSDMNYYNGIVLAGYINGVCECVLFGGRYDKLISKMGKRGGGVGFAIYTDLLASFDKECREYDVDVLLIHKPKTSVTSIQRAVEDLVAQGKSVSVQMSIPKSLRYKELKEMED